MRQSGLCPPGMMDCEDNSGAQDKLFKSNVKIDLYHGDCLDIMPEIPDKSIDAIITDPPYGTTACKWDAIIPFDLMWKELHRVTKDNGAIVLFGSEPFSSALRMSNIKNYKYDWVWDKASAGNFNCAKHQPLKIHELISVFNGVYRPQMVKGRMRNKGGKVASGDASRNMKPVYYRSDLYYPKSILAFKGERSLHPTQKPVALMEYLIKTYTNEGETVLDFTMGSGTTGVACKILNRNFIGIEKEKKYFDIAKKRIELA